MAHLDSSDTLHGNVLVLLQQLGLNKVWVRQADGELIEIPLESLEDAINYLNEEIEVIQNLLTNSFDRKRQSLAQATGQKITDIKTLDVVKSFPTVPSGGPSDGDLSRKKAELETKLATLRSHL